MNQDMQDVQDSIFPFTGKGCIVALAICAIFWVVVGITIIKMVYP